jgi:hypothetical protein
MTASGGSSHSTSFSETGAIETIRETSVEYQNAKNEQKIMTNGNDDSLEEEDENNTTVGS